MTNTREFEALRRDILCIVPVDATCVSAIEARDICLTKPRGSLGRLETISRWYGGWSGQSDLELKHPQAIVFVGDHGVNAHHISAYPPEVTQAMVTNFKNGGGAINQVCKANGIDLSICDFSTRGPSGDIVTDNAMSPEGFLDAIRLGASSLHSHADLVCIGEMGIGNTTPAASVCHAILGGVARDWVGRGTGVSGSGLARKRVAVAQAVRRIQVERDPLQILRRIGGYELAAAVGCIVAARHRRIPVILDGFVISSAALTMWRLNPASLDHCLFSHRSAENSHGRLLRAMRRRPLLDLDMRLGEGSAAALAVGIVRSALACHRGMATFGEADVPTTSTTRISQDGGRCDKSPSASGSASDSG